MNVSQTNYSFDFHHNLSIFPRPIKTTMQGFVRVEIPTKKYIAAYVHHRLGKTPKLEKDTTIGAKLYDVLEHKSNERKKEFSTTRYDAKLYIFISISTFRIRGCYLNHTNIKQFNRFLEAEIKERYRTLLDDLIEIFPSFEGNLPFVRRKIGIDLEAWSDDSIKKDYYRYRQKKGLPSLYDKNTICNKKYSRTVPSVKWY